MEKTKLDYQDVNEKIINEELVKECEILRKENTTLKKELEAYKVYADLFELASDTIAHIVSNAQTYDKTLNIIAKNRK